MAFLSTSDQAAIQSAIDLLEKGTAVEFPISDDTISRLAPLVESPTFSGFGVSTGAVFETLRDHPISGLITFVEVCGETALTDAQYDALQAANQKMLLMPAYERPFDAGVIDELAAVSDSTGFLNTGAFKEAVRDRPVSTMLRWALYLGSI